MRYKFFLRAHSCVFLRYPYGKKGYKVYDLEKGKLFVLRDVVFCEKNFLFELNTTSLPHSHDHITHDTPIESLTFNLWNTYRYVSMAK